jgi:aspartate aminotransferase
MTSARRAIPDSLNLSLRGMRSSATVAINERSDELRRRGREIFKLGLGQSPFPVPEVVVQALREHAAEKDYLPVRGLRALRDAVAAHHVRTGRLDPRTGDDVLIGPGSKELMFALQLCFYGDLVIPAPSWVSYAPQARMLGRRVFHLPTRREDRYNLRPDVLADLCARDPGAPRLLVLNYPNNPTGFTYSADELAGLAEVARTYGVLVLSDEIYGPLDHEDRHTSIARLYPEGTILSGGLSKWCGAGGWRLGTMLFPPDLRWLVDAMASVASETYTTTSAPIQHAAVTAYTDHAALADYLDGSRRILRALGGWLSSRLRGAGARCATPQGGFYVVADFGPLRGQLERRGIHSDAALCERLLEDTGVAMLPGSDFGLSPAALAARIAYVDFDGGRALAAARQRPADQALDESFLTEHCSRVVRAIESLSSWLA